MSEQLQLEEVCDTVVAMAEVTADGMTVFGKSSDREPNEGKK